jgi:hypothetical protein
MGKSSLSYWGGCLRSGGVYPNATGLTDYDRACEISNYVGVIAVGGGHALVLGDEPLQSTWIASQERTGGIIVRWQYAENEASAITHATSISVDAFESTGLQLMVADAELYLFDSAIAGESVNADNSLVIELERQTYSIDTALYHPDKKTGLIIHRLTPTTDSGSPWRS